MSWWGMVVEGVRQMTNNGLTFQDVERLKNEGRYFHAGALAWSIGHDDNYGCHYGMCSDRAYAIREYRQGWKEASTAHLGKGV
jgi:hypothetical protein